MTEPDVIQLECRRARQAVHRALDGEALEPETRKQLEAHSSTCESCSAFREDLEKIQRSLRSLPETELPEQALETVWSRTTRAGASNSERRGWRLDWRSFGVAAVLTAAAFGVWEWTRWSPSAEPRSTVDLIVIDPERVRTDPEYARRIADRARRALARTSAAWQRTERAAVHDVLDDISDALQRVPVDWPDTSSPRPRENEL